MTKEISSSNSSDQSGWVFKGLLPYLLLVVLSLPLLAFYLNTFPPVWFDEGYKLNAARTLSERGVYGTYTTAGYIPFDPGISSGPLDLIPVAAVFKVFGASVARARLVSIVFTMISIISVYGIAQMIYGARVGLFVGLFALAVPAFGDTGFLLIGRQILGEPAALACTLLGLWLWFRSWKSNQWWLVILAGVVMGLGMLSKTQVAIALFPALGLTALLRWWKYRRDFLRLFAPAILIVVIFGLWMVVGQFNTPPDVRQENSEMLMDAIRTNLLTPLLGQGLQRVSWLIAVVMGLGIVFIARDLLRRKGETRLTSDEEWAGLTLGILLLFYTVWFVGLSIGWPRYAYVGLVIALIPVGKLVWDGWTWLYSRVKLAPNRGYSLSIGALCLVAIATNLYPALNSNPVDNAQAVADYIDANIPPEAVIETWDWQIDGLTQHWEFHHPHQRYLFEAIRQFSHEREPFHVDYDILTYDPDYLIAGDFSTWTEIYKAEQVEANFVPLATFGTYTIYQRQRAASTSS